MSIRRLAVYCGSRVGNQPIFREQAQLLGQTLGKRAITLVYGGGNIGLMGAVADGTLSAGGSVIGVITKYLRDKEIAHHRLTELIIVETMNERKNQMAALADGFIALPGSYGTLEEVSEMMTNGLLGFHHKPIAFLNTAGYYEDLIRQIKRMTTEGFLDHRYADMLIIDDNIGNVLDRMSEYTPPKQKWAD